MSMSPTLPMIGPDGTAALIPREQAQAAANAGARPAIRLYSPDGVPSYVPLNRLGEAIKAGGMTEGMYQESKKAPAAAPQNNDAGLVSTPLRFLKGAGSALLGAGSGLYHTLTDSPQNPGEDAALRMTGPQGLIAYRMGLQPQIEAGKQGIADLKAGNTTQGIGGLAAAALPLAGPAAAQIGRQVGTSLGEGDYAGAAGNLTANAALALLLHKASAKLTPTPAVPGENFTPEQLQAHSGLLGRMTGLGDNFVPQQAAADTLSTVRQAAADNPTITRAARTKGSTPQNVAALQAILQKANTALEAPHEATINQFAGAPADVTPIQAAVKASLPTTLAGVAPEEAAALQELSNRLGTVNTMGGLNSLRQWLNDEASASYKQDSIASARGTATKGAFRSAADAARNSYFDQLQQLSGTDFHPVKAQQSALMSQQEGAASLGRNLAAQQAIADEPRSPQQTISEALTGGRAIKAGPLAGVTQLIAEKVLHRTPLTQPNYLIRNMLGDTPYPTQPPTTTGVPAPPPTAAPLPQVGGAPNPALQPPPGIVPVPPPIPTTMTMPQPVGLPSPAAPPQLPSGAVARFLTESAGPSNVQTAYPRLNPNTAATRIVPTKFASPETINPVGVRVVTPQGEVLTTPPKQLGQGSLAKAAKAMRKAKK